MAEYHADLVVVGAGPAGIAAACCAAEAGRRVVMLDESPRPGGQIWRHRERAQLPVQAQRWLTRLDRSGATLLSGVTVIDARGTAVTGERAGATVTVHADAAAYCVGARERFLPFPGWTLPGVVGVGGGQALLKAGMDVRGKRAVVAGSGPLLFPVAAALAKQGALIELVAEQTPLRKLVGFATGLWRSPDKLIEAARYRFDFSRARFAAGSWVVRAEGTSSVEQAVLTDGSSARTIPCDLLCVGYGLVPATELARLAGCALDGDGNVTVDQHQQTSVPNVYCAGETTGVGGVDAALVEGQIAGHAAGRGGAQIRQSLLARRDRYRRFATQLNVAFALRAELRSLAEPNTIVCRCEDVHYDLLAGMKSIREAKLYTRAGMGPCQGRVCGAALQYLFGWSLDTVRLPIAAAQVATLAE